MRGGGEEEEEEEEEEVEERMLMILCHGIGALKRHIYCFSKFNMQDSLSYIPCK